MFQTCVNNIIFDLDGTLVNSAGDVIHCLSLVYDNHPEIPHGIIDESIIGPPLSVLIQKISPGISSEQTEIITAGFRACYDNSSFQKTTLYDGVLPLIQTLKQQGVRLFIATNKPNIVTKRIIQNLNINTFDDIISLDSIEGERMNKTDMVSHLIQKWNLDIRHTVMVGDDASDIIAAHHNGLISVAVESGYGNKEALAKVNPTFTIQSLKNFYRTIIEIDLPDTSIS